MRRKILAIPLSLVMLISLIIPGNFSVVSAENVSKPGEETATIPGNIISNPEFDNNDFAEAVGYFKWYPNASTISQDNTYAFASGNSMKISNRTTFWSRAEYREWFGNLVYDKEYYLQGAVSASSAANLELHVDVIGYGGPTGNEYPMVSLTLDSASVDKDVWKVLSGSIKVTAEQSTTEGKVDATVHFDDKQYKIEGVTGIDCIQIFVQEAYNTNTTFPDLYLDSFLLKEGVAPHRGGPNSEQVTANKLSANSGFETNDFGTGHQYFKWYPNPDTGATISQVNNYSYSGDYSLKVSNRSQATERVQYREWFGNLSYETDYVLSGHVSATTETPVELVAVVWGYGGPTGNEYPSAVMTLDSGTANSADWTHLHGIFNVSSTESATEGKIDAVVTWGNQSQTLAGIVGVDNIEFYIQQPSGVTSYPDLFVDSFMIKDTLPTGHENASNTEEITNLIDNSSFETDSFATDHAVGQWYKTIESTAVLSQFSGASHSGSNSLRVSERAAHWHRGEYRVDGSEIVSGQAYSLSGYVLTEEDTTMELIIEVIAENGGEDSHLIETITMDSESTTFSDWTKLEGKFRIIQSVNASNPSKYDFTIIHDGKSVVISEVGELKAVQIDVQEAYHEETVCPDIYMDSFILQEAPSPASVAAGGPGTYTDMITMDAYDAENLPTAYQQDKYIWSWTYKGEAQTTYDITRHDEHYVADFTDKKMLAVRKQDNSATADPAADTLNIRVIGSVNSLNYDVAGFAFSISNPEPTVGGTGCLNRESTTVYEYLNANGAPQHVNSIYDKYSNYMFAFEITDIPATGDGTVIYVRSYVRRGDIHVYGDTKALTVKKE